MVMTPSKVELQPSVSVFDWCKQCFHDAAECILCIAVAGVSPGM